jgi:hypothetical protein
VHFLIWTHEILEGLPIENVVHLLRFDLRSIPSSIHLILKAWTRHQPAHPILEIKVDERFDRNLDFYAINRAWSKKSLPAGMAIAELAMVTVCWVLWDGRIALKFRFICAMTLGIRRGGINGVLPVEKELSSSGTDINRKIRH